MMRSLATLLLLLDSSAVVSHLRYQRSVVIPSPGQVCTVLDPVVYMHAAPTLADLRLVAQGQPGDLPFALLVNGSINQDPDPARILGLHQAGRGLAFDLEMPPRLYTDVVLHLGTPHLLAHAVVTAAGASLGDFTLFDLNAEHLPADTTLHLQETAAPVLHVTLTPLAGAPTLSTEALNGVTVPPSREAQTLFTTALSTTTLDQHNHQTVARFHVPAHLPIDRVRIILAPGKSDNFLRSLRITSHVAGEPESSGEEISGTVGHLRLERDGASLRADQLTVLAALGANLQQPADVRITVENGSAAPLPIASVALETRQRQLCFDAPPSTPVTLFYGDPKLEAPPDNGQHPFHLAASVRTVALGPEQLNPRYTPRAGSRPFLRRHPRLFSLGSILLICLAAITALRSRKLRV